MEKRYQIILWDVDGTLLNFLESERYALKEVFRYYGIEIDGEINDVYSAINESYWKRLEKREVTKEQVLRGRFEDLFEEFMPGKSLEFKNIDIKTIRNIDIDEFRMVYQKNLGSVYFYQDDSLKLCEELQKEGFLQFVITNGVTWTQKNKLTLAGFYNVMEDIFISEEIGFHKPDVRFFEIIQERIINKLKSKEIHEYDLRQMLIVGDSQTSDMQLARNAGVDCCLYTHGKGTVSIASGQEVTYQISHLNELKEILWQKQKNKD